MGKKILAAGIFLGLSVLVFNFGVSNAQQDSATSGSMIRNQAQDRIGDIQERKQELQDQHSARKAEFREKLQTIRSEVKRKVVERIDTRMGNVNLAVTNRFSAVLDKLQDILNRFIGRAEDEKLAGKDTGDVDVAIGSAQAAIDNAKAAVASQAANLYVIDITTETALKGDVGGVVSQLRADLKNVHKMIVDAKQAVQNVVTELAKLRGNRLGEENTATGSSQ